MQLINEQLLVEWINSRGWLKINAGQIDPIPKAHCYKGTYSLGGLTASNVAEGFLCEFVEGDITSGVILLRDMIPPEPPPFKVFQYLLGLPDHNLLFSINKPIILFQDEYLPLLTIMSWCLDCDWEFDFIATPQKFLLKKWSDQRTIIVWDQLQPMQPKLEELLTSWDFEPCP